MRFLVFQHIESEHPGVFRDLMRDAEVAWDAVELDEGERIPALEQYDALMVMGGPMDVWDTDEHPWLQEEKEAIRRWTREMGRPFLGVCLGHQLLADALGGACRRMEISDVGITDMALTAAGRRDPVFSRLDAVTPVLQWHGVEVSELPDESEVLARSAKCGVEAFRVGSNAYGVQGHAESTATTVDEWATIPEYREALERTLGPNAVEPLREHCAACMPAFGRAAKSLFGGFLEVVRA